MNTTFKRFAKTSAPGSQEDAVYQKINELIASYQKLLAKLDSDAGVTDTNYKALLNVQDVDHGATPLIPSPIKESV